MRDVSSLFGKESQASCFPMLHCLNVFCKFTTAKSTLYCCSDREWEAQRPRAREHHGALASAAEHGAVYVSDTC